MKPEITARLRPASSSKMMPSGRGSVVEMIALGCRSSLQQRNGRLGSGRRTTWGEAVQVH